MRPSQLALEAARAEAAGPGATGFKAFINTTGETVLDEYDECYTTIHDIPIVVRP